MKGERNLVHLTARNDIPLPWNFFLYDGLPPHQLDVLRHPSGTLDGVTIKPYLSVWWVTSSI